MDCQEIDDNIFITVILVTYDSDWKKTCRTLRSIIMQEKVKIELLVCDDGSESNNFEKIDSYLKKNKFKNFALIANKMNKGIVKNIISGLKQAKGRYVKPISPGDFFYKTDSLYEMYIFAEKSNCSACFARAVYYSDANDGIKTYDQLCNPVDLKPFLRKNNFEIKKSLLLKDNLILGASLFYRKDDFLEALLFSEKKIKFCEDISATFYFIAKRKKIRFTFLSSLPDKKICTPFIWYEYGTGISTNGNTNILQALHEKEKMQLLLIKKHLISRIYFVAKYGKNSLLKKIIKNALMPVRYFYNKLRIPYKQIVIPMAYDINYLHQIINSVP